MAFLAHYADYPAYDLLAYGSLDLYHAIGVNRNMDIRYGQVGFLSFFDFYKRWAIVGCP
jgi:hypothetical protein